jgi:hypothetical protein
LQAAQLTATTQQNQTIYIKVPPLAATSLITLTILHYITKTGTQTTPAKILF